MGGHLGTQSSDEAAAKFPAGPINLTIGQDPGGSTDLIGRALAEPVSDKLGVPVPVMNRPGANGALAAKELASQPPNGQSLMVINLSLVAITPLAVRADQAVDINNYEIITGISQDDYVLVSNAESGLKTVDDLKKAGKTSVTLRPAWGPAASCPVSCCSSWPRSPARACRSTVVPRP